MPKPKPSTLLFGALLVLACGQPAKKVVDTKSEDVPQTSEAPSGSTNSVRSTQDHSILLQGRVFFMPDGSRTPPVVAIATNDLWALTLAQHVGSRKIADFLFLVRANQATVLPDRTRAEVLEYIEYPSWIIVKIRILEGDLAGQTMFTFPEFLPASSLSPGSISNSPTGSHQSTSKSETLGKIANHSLRDPIYAKREAYIRKWYAEKYLPELTPAKAALSDVFRTNNFNDGKGLAAACAILNSTIDAISGKNLETSNFVLNRHLQTLLGSLRATGLDCRRGPSADLATAETNVNQALSNLELFLRPFALKP